jgi:hypothetical protein
MALWAGLALSSVRAEESKASWRFYEDHGKAQLVITDTDEATDNIGSPSFECTGASNKIIVRGEAKEPLRRAIAAFIVAGKYPKVDLGVDAGGYGSLLTIAYSEVAGWEYGFHMSASAGAFERFKRTGVLEFALGKTAFKEKFTVGLEAVTKFHAFCKPK